MMMQKRYRKNSLKILIIVIVGISLFFILSRQEILGIQEDILSKQADLEMDFKTQDYTFDNPQVILNPYRNAPLCALILFKSKDEEAVTVTITGKDEQTTYQNTFKQGINHILPIYGLYPDAENEVILEMDGQQKSIIIQTDKLPEDFVLPSSVECDTTMADSKLFFFTPSSKGYTFALDKNGDIRWYLTQTAIWEINRLKNGNLLVSSDRLMNLPYYMTGLYEMDLLGKVYREYRVPGGYHHDYYELDSGNLLVCSNIFNNESGTVEDVVVEIDRQTGKLVSTVDLKDILPMTSGRNEDWTSFDWFHNNSVWYDKKTDELILSGRHQDAVVAIDYSTRKLKWILGDSEGWDEAYQSYFLTPKGSEFEWQWEQHAAMLTPDGELFLFDNGKNKSKQKEKYIPAKESYSRGVLYRVDEMNKTVEQVWQYGKERGSEFYSPYISDVDYLGKEHYLIHSGGISYKDGEILNVPASLGKADTLKSITTEIVGDQVIFEVQIPANEYRVEKMDLYSSKGLELGQGETLGSLGETKVSAQYRKLAFYTEEPDEGLEKRRITFKREKDRLVICAQAYRDQPLSIILKQGINCKEYNIRATRKPYTAMCVDIFTTEEKKNGMSVTQYINEDGLEGLYQIYIKMDDKVYKTKKWVKF